MKRQPMTRGQKAVYQAISDLIEENGYAPNYREIAEKAGLYSASTVTMHVRHLQEKGWIDYDPRRARSIRLREDDMAYPAKAYYGKVSHFDFDKCHYCDRDYTPAEDWHTIELSESKQAYFYILCDGCYRKAKQTV